MSRIEHKAVSIRSSTLNTLIKAAKLLKRLRLYHTKEVNHSKTHLLEQNLKAHLELTQWLDLGD